jgi:imidazolonepropionase-like amidohydrolase
MLGADGEWQFDAALAREMAATGMRVIPTAAAGRRYERTGESWAASLPNKATGSGTRTRNAGRLLESGVSLVAGTDAGVAHTDFGEELFLELEAYVSVGMTPAAAIATATSSAAAHLGLDNIVGTLAAGRSPDVLVVQGDALSDITALRRTRLVMRAGKLITPVPPPGEPP